MIVSSQALAAQPLLQVVDLEITLSTRAGSVKAVEGVSFTVNRGETLGLIGKSGAGKSLSCLSLLQLLPKGARVTGGQILLNGEDLLRKSEREMRGIRGRRIAMILQDPMTSLNPVLSVGEQVAEPIRLHQCGDGRLARRKAVEALSAVRITDPELRIRDYPHQLSGGMRQRVSGAIALSCQPDVLIADEPTTSLDVTIQAQYLALLQEIQRRDGVAIIFVTHDLGIVAQMCDRVAVMEAGRVVESGPVEEVFDRPQHPFTQSLLRAHTRYARAHVAEAREQTVEALPSSQAEPSLTASVAGEPRTDSSPTPIVSLRNVTQLYPLRTGLGVGRPTRWLRAVDDVSFDVPSGKTFCIVGESGSGKSTTLRLILGAETPTSGTVSFRGRDLSQLGRAEWKELRRAVQPVFQNPWASLNPRQRIGDIIAEPLITAAGFSKRDAQERAAEALQEVGLSKAYLTRFPHEFSGGQRQRIAIARALALRPALVVLDEPVSSLDVGVRAQIIELLQDLQKRHNLTYMLVAHELPTVWALSDVVAVMYLGQIVEIGDAAAIRSSPLHPYTRALFAADLPSHPRERRPLGGIADDLPSIANPPSGCRFRTRCAIAAGICAETRPALRRVSGGRSVACHFVNTPTAHGEVPS